MYDGQQIPWFSEESTGKILAIMPPDSTSEINMPVDIHEHPINPWSAHSIFSGEKEDPVKPRYADGADSAEEDTVPTSMWTEDEQLFEVAMNAFLVEGQC